MVGSLFWDKIAESISSIPQVRFSLMNLNNDLRRIGLWGEVGDVFMGGSAWLLPASFFFFVFFWGGGLTV